MLSEVCTDLAMIVGGSAVAYLAFPLVPVLVLAGVLSAVIGACWLALDVRAMFTR